METATMAHPQATDIAGEVWTIDPLHSSVAFAIKHMRIATVHGRFGGFSGAIRFDPARPDDAAVEVEIDASTIDTREKRRDDHLRSADFFEVARYPVITFRSTGVELTSPVRRDQWRVAGDLTIHGVTRSVELAVEQTSGDPNPEAGEVMAWSASTTISRKAFGLGFNLPLDGGGLVIADRVAISLAIQARRGAIDGR